MENPNTEQTTVSETKPELKELQAGDPDNIIGQDEEE